MFDYISPVFPYNKPKCSAKGTELEAERAFADAAGFMDPARIQPMADNDLDQQPA